TCALPIWSGEDHGFRISVVCLQCLTFAADCLCQHAVADKHIGDCHCFCQRATGRIAHINHDFLRALFDQVLQLRTNVCGFAIIQTVNSQDTDSTCFHFCLGRWGPSCSSLHRDSQRACV